MKLSAFLLASSALFSAPLAQAAPYTWTSTTTGTLDWTTAGNWLDSTQYVSDPSNELIFFSDSTTFNAAGARNITTNVPTTLAMNTLTLNGRGASSGASSSNITIGSSASTWTIGDGTTSVVNLNANQGATTAAGWNYNIAANLTLNQASTLFTGNGTAGVHTGATDPGFVFSGSIGEAAVGYGITKTGSSRLTLSGVLNFTGAITVNGGMLILNGNSNPPSAAMTVNTGAILRIGNNTATVLNAGNYAGNISTGTGGTLQLWSSSAQTFSGVISGSGGINKAYAGTLTLSGANTYTGKTSFIPQQTAGYTVNVSSFNSVVGGTASSSLGAPTTVANGTIDLGSGGAQAGVNLTYTGAAALGETTDRVINVNFNGSASQTITANNASGLLRFTSAFTSNAGTQSGRLILSGTGAGQIDQGLPQLATGGLDKSGTGTWTLGGSGDFTRPTKINGGLLSLSSATALRFSPFDTTSVVGTASAGLKIATTTLSLGGLTGGNALDTRFTTALGGPLDATAQGGYAGLTALTLTNAQNTTSTYSGNIIEGGAGMTLTKDGAGTQFLTGTIGYTGLTTVSAGTLGSNGTFSGAATVALDAGLSPGAFAGEFGTLTISNASVSALTLNGGILQMDVSTASNDLIAVTGDTVLNGTTTVFLNPTTGVAAGTYNLVTSAATTGSGSVVFANGSTTLGDATLAVSAGNIQMTVGAGGLNHSVWVGTSATWDAGTNWNRNGTPSSAFSAGDWVTIDDTGSNAAAITSAAAVSPASLTVNNSSKAFIINANIGGTGTPLIKSGTNTLTLGGTNTYSGGTVINGGILAVNSNDRLGDASGGITLGGGQLNVQGANISAARSVTVNGTGSSMRVSRNNNITTSGALTGSGDIAFVDNGGGGNLSLYRFTSSGNTFTGAMTLGVADVRVSSLGDTLGNNIIFTGAGIFRLNDTGATGGLTFSNRAIELRNSSGTVENLNTTHALTIGSNLVATGAAAKTLTLTAAAGPTNIFSGTITDGSGGGTVALTKAGAGLWVLSGNNTYTGATTISSGTLAGIGANAFGSTSGISLTGTNTLSLRGDSSTSFASSNVTTSATGATINVNQATIAGTGAKTMTMGNLGTSSTAATYQLNFTGANNTSLSAGVVTTPTTASVTTHTINNTISGGGGLTLAGIAGGGTTTGTLAFSGNGNTTVTGAITQAGSAQALTKNGAGTLLLNGTNSYSGLTTVNAGNLGGTGSITGNVTVAAAGSLAPGASGAGTLNIGGVLDISAPANGGAGKLNFELGPIASSDKIALTGSGSLTIGGTFLDFSDFNFSALSGLQNGTYKLITSTNAISGGLDTTPANLTGPIGAGSGTLQITGNDVELVVSGIGVGSPYDTWASSKGLTGANNAKNLDPDNDGSNNLAEFAFNGNPLSGSDNGKVFVLTEDSDFAGDPSSAKELILTVAVRTGTPAFGGSPSPSATQAADGITYSIEGSLDLASFPTVVNVVPTPVVPGLPPAGAGYEYRSFSLGGSNGLSGKGFLRAKVTSP